MSLDGQTQVLGILGDPVAHSLSPRMQNAAIAAAGLNAIYVPFHVAPLALPAAVAGLRALGLRGVNVTVPHKEAVLPMLDEVTPEARSIGAVNTIVQEQGRLVGANTDAPGFLRSLREDLGIDPVGCRVVVLGAGGAARAALYALAQSQVKGLTLVNRTPERARALLADLLPPGSGTSVRVGVWAAQDLTTALRDADLVVNTTSLGLHGEPFPLPWEALSRYAVGFDMVYAPGATPFVASFREAGRPAVDGRGMLAAQGEEAFRLWFGSAPPAGVMRGVLEERSEIRDIVLS